VKYSKKLLSAILAIGVLSVAVFFARDKDAAVRPAAWIVDAAVAMNREEVVGSPHGAAQAADDHRSASRQAAHAGEQLRVQRKFAEAASEFRKAVEADPTDADSWADLADCEAAAVGNDLTAGREAIMRAIQIDPHHRKGLWLRASLELQEQRYSAAAATWRELLTLVPPGSTDARVIAANVSEADTLAGTVSVADGRGS
jgi:tetratricopeptide (TPR) repeat protein